MTTDGVPELRTLDAHSVPTIVEALDGFGPFAVATGPDGWFAALGIERPCCQLMLLLIGPDGAQRRLILHGRDANEGGGPIELSWGAAGLIAVSPRFPDAWDEREGTTWATVVDPRAGEIVATIDDAVGTAWSPEGTALLVGQPTSPRVDPRAHRSSAPAGSGHRGRPTTPW